MNRIYLYVNNVKEQIAYPFSFSNLLDERLDEATVTIYGSTTKEYPPLAKAELYIMKQDETALEDKITYLISRDDSEEFPIGSGRYKHILSLIEETKELDGIVCSSLTFTNSLPNSNYSIPTKIEEGSILGGYTVLPKGFFSTQIKSNVFYGKTITFPSIQTIGFECRNALMLNLADPSIIAEFEVFDKYNDQNSSFCSIHRKNDDNTRTEIYDTEKIDEDISFEFEKEKSYYIDYHIIYRILFDEKGVKSENISYWTLSFPFETNGYTLKKWSITDCVLRVLECAEPLFDTENPRYSFQGVEYTNGVASKYEEGSQADEYDKILAPEFTMTQCTLREQLKVIGSFIHAEPRLKDGIIYFEKYGTTNISSLQKNCKYIRKVSSFDINNYATDVRSYAQNIVSNSDIDTGTIEQRGERVKCETSNVRVEADNAVGITRKPIQCVKRLEVGIYSGGNEFVPYTDVTPYLLEETNYSALASAYTSNGISKAMSIYYSIGKPNIRGLFYVAPQATVTSKIFAISTILGLAQTAKTIPEIQEELEKNVSKLVFRISYIPFYDIFVSHGKTNTSSNPSFSLITNQSENVVDTQYFGEHLKGLASRLGNPEEERTYILKEYKDIPKIGDIITVDSGERILQYAISAITCEIMPYHIKCTANLTQDFNRLSEYIGVNSIKRLWQISEREVYDRNILIKESLVVSRKNENQNCTKTTIHNLLGLYKMLIAGTSYKYFNTDCLPVNLKGINDITAIQTEKIDTAYCLATNISDDITNPTSQLRFNVLTARLGNAAIATLYAKDNYSADTQLNYVTSENNVSGWWNNDVKYTDYSGNIFWFRFAFAQNKETNFASTFEWTENEYKSSTPYINYARSISSIPKLRLRKDNRERITISCNLEAKSGSDDIIIGPEFMELNASIFGSSINNTVPRLSLYVLKRPFAFDKFASSIANYGNNLTSDKYYRFDLLYSDIVIKNESDKQLNSTDSNIQDVLEAKTIRFKIKADYNLMQNIGYGYIIATSPSPYTENMQDKDGSITQYTYDTGGKILLTCTAKIIENIELDFYITK